MRHKWWSCSEMWLRKKKFLEGFLPSQQFPVEIALLNMHQPLHPDFLRCILQSEAWMQKPNSCFQWTCHPLATKKPQMLQSRPKITVSWRQQFNTARAQTEAECGFMSVLANLLHCGCQKHCRTQIIPKHNQKGKPSHTFWINYQQGSCLSSKRLLRIFSAISL